jgi:hypothetical protein
MIQTAVEIKIGDYIKSDFFSPMQETVTAFGIIGKNIPVYQIELPNGKVEYIIKGQAVLMWTLEEWEQHLQPLSRHD